MSGIMLLLIKQRYNFESNSQRWKERTCRKSSCCLSSKDTISKAIHNSQLRASMAYDVVAYQAKIQFRKQFTTNWLTFVGIGTLLLIKQRYNFESNSQQDITGFNTGKSCCLSSKDTISKAIHNNYAKLVSRS